MSIDGVLCVLCFAVDGVGHITPVGVVGLDNALAVQSDGKVSKHIAIEKNLIKNMLIKALNYVDIIVNTPISYQILQGKQSSHVSDRL